MNIALGSIVAYTSRDSLRKRRWERCLLPKSNVLEEVNEGTEGLTFLPLYICMQSPLSP
jgi:hypothetical protein